MKKKELLHRIECLEELTLIMSDEIKSLRKVVGYPLDLGSGYSLDPGFKVVPKVWPFAESPTGRLASTKILSPAQ